MKGYLYIIKYIDNIYNLRRYIQDVLLLLNYKSKYKLRRDEI